MKNQRINLFLLLVALLSMTACESESASTAEAAERPPNIIIIFADELG